MPRNIRILHVSPGFPPVVGGEEKCVYILYQHLNRPPFELQVLVGKNSLYSQCKTPLIQCSTKGTFFNYLLTFIKFFSTVKNADIVHYHYPNSFFPNVSYGLLTILTTKLLKKPYILHIHLLMKFKSKFWLKLLPFYNYYFKTLLESANFILIPSSYSKNLLIKQFGLDSSKIKILPYGIQMDLLQLKQSQERKPTKIIFIGRLSKVKNIDKLIHAVTKLDDSIRLHIYGSGEEEEKLKLLVKDQKNIFFEGRLSTSEIQKAYQNAKLMILPSSNEEQPISILEALASGVPVLATPLPSVKSHYKDLIFYTTGTILDLRQKILNILEQNLELKINQGREFAKNFTWDKITSQVGEYYRKLLKSQCLN